MRNFISIVRAEIIKQHRNVFQSNFIYFTLLLWPILILVNVYYTYKPFNLESSNLASMFGTTNSLLTFLITGSMAYNCFWSMVQSAWQMNTERQDGTLEVIFQSPANRFAIIYGRALGSLIENIWMFSLFCLVSLYISGNLSFKSIFYLPITFIILIFSATIWGGFMNAIFMFSRDASFMFNLCDDPMNLFSGVKIPIEIMPFVTRIISYIFPLTHALVIVRYIINYNTLCVTLNNLLAFFASSLAIFLITIVLLKISERNARKTGNLMFY